MSHDNKPNRQHPPSGGETALASPLFKELSEGRTETLTLTIVQGGEPGTYGEVLFDIPNGPLSCNSDLQWRLGILVPLRDWLEIHGAFTPGSGVWVRIVSERENPDEVAEDGPISGRVIDSCRITTTIRSHAVNGG